MQIASIGDTIEVDGVVVATLVGRRTREREAFRDAMRENPELHWEPGGTGSLADLELSARLEEAENECADLEGDVAKCKKAIFDALALLEKGEVSRAISRLNEGVD